MMHPYPKFIRAIEQVESGEVEALVFHVDSLRLLTDDDWDLLKEAGLDVGVFQKQESE
jgi:hypothetical protein